MDATKDIGAKADSYIVSLSISYCMVPLEIS